MKISCRACGTLLPPTQLNLATDVAICWNCGEAFSISAMVAAGQNAEHFDINQPPNGAWFERTAPGWQIGATTRSSVAVFIVPGLCVWSGFALGGIYGTQIVHREFNLLSSLFGVPFVLATLFFGSVAAMTVCGKVTVSTDGNEGRVFTGIGPFGWIRRFDWSAVSAVTETPSLARDIIRNQGVVMIALSGQSLICFGSLLSEARRYYMLKNLQRLLVDRENRLI